MKYTDFKEGGSESAVKAAGKYLQQGKNYVVEDGDIIFFKVQSERKVIEGLRVSSAQFNAGAGLKGK